MPPASFGHYVLQDLLNTVPASQIVAIVRNPAKAQALSQQGVVVRQADYSDEAALTAALQGVDKLLLISQRSRPACCTAPQRH